MPVRVLIVDDHDLMRRGIRMVLETEPDLEVVGEAASGEEAVRLASRLEPDVVIMDISLPGISGIEATRLLRAASPQVRVLGLTIYEDEGYVRALLRAGGDGFIVKRSAAQELVRAIRAVVSGRAVLDPHITRSVVEAYIARTPEAAEPQADPFTPREREILVMAAGGMTNARIARELHISIKTVQTHRAHIMEKVGAHDRIDLVRYAIRQGWLTP